MGLPDRGMAPRRKIDLGVFVKKSGLGSSSRIAQKSNFSAAIPSAMNGLLQCFDEALIALGPTKGGLQEATTTAPSFECGR